MCVVITVCGAHHTCLYQRCLSSEWSLTFRSFLWWISCRLCPLKIGIICRYLRRKCLCSLGNSQLLRQALSTSCARRRRLYANVYFWPSHQYDQLITSRATDHYDTAQSIQYVSINRHHTRTMLQHGNYMCIINYQYNLKLILKFIYCSIFDHHCNFTFSTSLIFLFRHYVLLYCHVLGGQHW